MTRFSGISPRLAVAILLVSMVLISICFTVNSHGRESSASLDDQHLYQSILHQVEHGKGYYTSVAIEQRARHYPLRPVQAVREPYMTWLLAALKTDAIRRLAMIGLSVAAILAMMRNFARIGLRSEMRFTMLLLLVAGCLGAWLRDSIYFHEHWAAMLIVLSIGLYRPDRHILSIVAALAACLIRELAVAFLLTMLLFALFERRWNEAFHWGTGLAVFALAYGAHAHFAMETYQMGDLQSPSWLALGGIPFVLEAARRSVLLVLMPAGIVGIFLVLTVLGFAGCQNPLISRIAFFVCGCLAAFLFVGRPNNGYWGLLLAPLLPLGVALAPAAIRDLALAARETFVPVRHT